MAENNWGHCQDCQWFQVEPDASVDESTPGHCIQPELQPFMLRVSGASGCNHFLAGQNARAEGASAEPPVAVSSR